MKRIDINADLGEGFGKYSLCKDEEMLTYFSSVNIACGFHAGDPNIMRKVTVLCAKHNIGIGCHPGFPDLMGFGRRFMQCSYDELENYFYYQLGALDAFARVAGSKLQHCNLHGAWGNWTEREEEAAQYYAKWVKKYNPDLITKCVPGGFRHKAAREIGLRTACEFFADRNMMSNYRLVPRSQENAVIKDRGLIIERLVRLVTEGKVRTVDGVDLELNIQTITMHSDTPGAAEIARDVRKALEDNGVEIVRLDQLV